ncbi:hypothetical protein CB1_001506001 [Camelus ferus]|nr:hypothetical protein CB1_001506001 [Camelus ferus]
MSPQQTRFVQKLKGIVSASRHPSSLNPEDQIRRKPEVGQQIAIYTKGSVPQFVERLQDNLTIVAGIFIGIAFLQIWGFCLAQNLVSDIEAVKATWQSACHSCSKTLDRPSLPDRPLCPADTQAARTLITEAPCDPT